MEEEVTVGWLRGGGGKGRIFSCFKHTFIVLLWTKVNGNVRPRFLGVWDGGAAGVCPISIGTVKGEALQKKKKKKRTRKQPHQV